ncbi:TPA: galactose-6-phosphate isomerase [Streptococcus pneumoniae]|nr:galactose-6-phosphate isomerase [Streptococcus pneumoniae]
MSQSIVPVEIPQYCRFDSKKRNGILFNVRIANLILYPSNERSSI